MDDFDVYSTALSVTQIDSLAKGTAPGAVSGNPGLIAHWDFNDAASAVTPTVAIGRAGAGATITYSGTLQSADSPAGLYTDVAGATSPHAVTTGSAQKNYRTRN